MTLFGRNLDSELIKILKVNNEIHFNAILTELLEISNEACNKKTLSRHLHKLCANGVVVKAASTPGKKGRYSLSADSEIALLINKDFNLFPNKKFRRAAKEEKLKEDIRLVLIRLAIISYVKYLDPKANHLPGTIYLPMDESGNTYTFSFLLRDKKLNPNAIPEKLFHAPVEPIPEAQGVSVRDLQQPPKKMSEMGKLYGHISLSNKELKRCIGILTRGSTPLVSRSKLWFE